MNTNTNTQNESDRTIHTLTNELLEDLFNPSITTLDLCQIHRLTLPELAAILESESFTLAVDCRVPSFSHPVPSFDSQSEGGRSAMAPLPHSPSKRWPISTTTSFVLRIEGGHSEALFPSPRGVAGDTSPAHANPTIPA